MRVAPACLWCLLGCFAPAHARYGYDEPGDLQAEDGYPVWPVPATQLPEINGSAFPPYRMVFTRGECDANDVGLKINVEKTCFSCFRIPTMIKTNAPGGGSILVFAEARRGTLTATKVLPPHTGSGMFSCPDVPDVRLVYKRSVDGGQTWSPLKVFLQPPGRAENGGCQNQAAPVVDPVTNVIFVAFNSQGACDGYHGIPMIVNSTDDGVTWSVPAPMIINGVAASANTAIIGPTKGLAITLPGGATRLMLPGEGTNTDKQFGAASIYSDDHGKTWNSNGTATFGEMDWIECAPGSCAGKGKYAMIKRGSALFSSFSNDSTHWSPLQATVSPDVAVTAGHGKAGLVSVPGGLVSSQLILQCPAGVRSCSRKPSDVVGSGVALMASKDGITWRLLKKLWPFGGMYSTMIPLTSDKDGAALSYGVVYTAGSISYGALTGIIFQNFTSSPSDFEVEDVAVMV